MKMTDSFKDAQYALDYIEEEYPYKKGTVGGRYIEKVRLALNEAEQLRKDLTKAQNDCLFFATYCLNDKSDPMLVEQAKHFIEAFNKKDN
jgi:hypothetical protein